MLHPLAQLMRAQWRESGLSETVQYILFSWASGNPADFFPLESVWCLVVSINTAHWGRCLQHPDKRGQQAGRGRGHAEATQGKLLWAHVGTGAVREGRWCRTTSHRLCWGWPPPTEANPTPRRGIWKPQGHGQGRSARLWPLQDPLLILSPKGQGEWAAFPESAPHSWGLR